MLGAMEARNELRQLYRDEAAPGVRRRILEALGVAEDVETLAAVARQEQDLALRREAIQGLGINESAKAKEALRALYGAYPDVPTRKAVIEALMVQENARALIEIFKAETNRELRREIVQHLSHMSEDSEEAAKFLEQIYGN
jgi:HEAT repeat protein